MKRFRFGLLVSMTSLFSLLVCNQTQAQESLAVNMQGQPVIISTVPAPKEVVVIPTGYVNCFIVPAGWNYKNVWVAEHKVCQYSPNNGGEVQGVAWVESYWACIKYINASDPKKGECTDWQWQPAHWVKTLDVY